MSGTMGKYSIGDALGIFGSNKSYFIWYIYTYLHSMKIIVTLGCINKYINEAVFQIECGVIIVDYLCKIDRLLIM